MTPAEVRIFCKLDATGQSLMRSATQSEQLQLSARAFHRVLKIARTIPPGTYQGLPAWRAVTKSPRRTLRLRSGQVWPRQFSTGRDDRNRKWIMRDITALRDRLRALSLA